jgi:colanic acid biosynthesis glycosyl transferase WcaI
MIHESGTGLLPVRCSSSSSTTSSASESNAMRILYVSQYFPPEVGAPAARVYELSRHWVAAGHRVSVLTGFPNHPRGVMPPEYRRWWRRGTMREVVQGIEVVRTWLYPAPNRRPWERIVNYTSFFVSAALRGLALPRTDVVIATSTQLLVGLAGWWLARARRCPFVFEVRDLWPESLVASGIGSEKALWIRALGRLARFLYDRADLVVTVTEAMRQELVLRYGVPGNRVGVAENGVEIELFAPRADRDAVRRELGLEGRFVAAYIGTIG